MHVVQGEKFVHRVAMMMVMAVLLELLIDCNVCESMLLLYGCSLTLAGTLEKERKRLRSVQEGKSAAICRLFGSMLANVQ